MADFMVLSIFFFLSLVGSITLYVRKRTSILRGALAFLILISPFIGDICSWVEGYGTTPTYDHGTADEFLLAAQSMILWALFVMALSLLLSRQEPTTSLVFPTIFFLYALQIVISVITNFQDRWAHYYYFYYYSQIFNH